MASPIQSIEQLAYQHRCDLISQEMIEYLYGTDVMKRIHEHLQYQQYMGLGYA